MNLLPGFSIIFRFMFIKGRGQRDQDSGLRSKTLTDEGASVAQGSGVFEICSGLRSKTLTDEGASVAQGSGVFEICSGLRSKTLTDEGASVAEGSELFGFALCSVLLPLCSALFALHFLILYTTTKCL
jgi:hypothetical protein